MSRQKPTHILLSVPIFVKDFVRCCRNNYYAKYAIIIMEGKDLTTCRHGFLLVVAPFHDTPKPFHDFLTFSRNGSEP